MPDKFWVTIEDKTKEEYWDAYKWCLNRWGDPYEDPIARKAWWPSSSSVGAWYSGTFVFYDKEDALLFKIIWG